MNEKRPEMNELAKIIADILSHPQDDATESVKGIICDYICQYRYCAKNQDEMDEICADCIVNKIAKIEV